MNIIFSQKHENYPYNLKNFVAKLLKLSQMQKNNEYYINLAQDVKGKEFFYLKILMILNNYKLE